MPQLMLAELDALAILSRVLHTTCAATLLGGAVYLRFVLAPAGQVGDPDSIYFAGRRSAWAMCVGACTALLLVSGFYNYVATVLAYEVPRSYHIVFGAKFLLAFVVFALMALLAGKSSGAMKVRTNMKLWLNVSLAATLAVFVLGAVLRSIDKVPKSDAPAATEADTRPRAGVLHSKRGDVASNGIEQEATEDAEA